MELRLQKVSNFKSALKIQQLNEGHNSTEHPLNINPGSVFNGELKFYPTSELLQKTKHFRRVSRVILELSFFVHAIFYVSGHATIRTAQDMRMEWWKNLACDNFIL